MAKSKSTHSSTTAKSVESSDHTKSTSQSSASKKKNSIKQKNGKGKATKKKGKQNAPQEDEAKVAQQAEQSPLRGRSPSPNRNGNNLPRAPSIDRPRPRRAPSQERRPPPPLRRPPPRSRSDDRGLRPMARGRPNNLPPLPSQHPRGRGRSMSPGRRPGPRPRSMDPAFRHEDRSNHQAMSRSEHFAQPRRNYSRGPPPPHMRRGERSGHSRSGHSTIANSQHSRASMMNSRHSRGGGPRRRDPSNDSRMSRASNHSRMSRGSHHSRMSRSGSGHSRMSRSSGHSRMSRPSLADQKRRRRGQRMYDSMRDISRGKFNKGKCCCSYVIPVTVLIAAAIGLLVATGGGNVEPIDESAPPTEAPANGGFEDPFESKSVPKWPSSGSGLEVTIVNAMSDDWNDIFSSVAQDWEFGNPDAITVTSQDSSHDKDCAEEAGTIKVCSGNYGATKWMGFTNHKLDGNGDIVASTVRINEYYLSGTGKSLRQYTLCHEMGHALGLEHTSEDAQNDHLGGCMAYTSNVAANKHPYRNSYESLFNIYGPVATSRRLGRVTD